MVTHSSILAWRIPWTEEPGRLQSVGSRESDVTAIKHSKNHQSNLAGLSTPARLASRVSSGDQRHSGWHPWAPVHP